MFVFHLWVSADDLLAVAGGSFPSKKSEGSGHFRVWTLFGVA